MFRRISTLAARPAPRRGLLRAGSLAVAVAVAGCGEPRGPAFAPSPEAVAAPRPLLGETEPMRRALAAAEAGAARLAVAGDALTARADALGSRAAGLAGPVIAPDRRGRLLDAAEARAAGEVLPPERDQP